MSAVHKLITDHLDIWTASDTEKKSGRGRASGNANSVYGIKKLRGLILELAVRGKLVPQDPDDEPASELLRRILTEKTKLVADKKIKKDKPLSPISEGEVHYELPSNWIWTRLGEITNFGATEKLEQIPDDMWVLDLEDIEKDTSKLHQKFKFFERRSLSDKNSFHTGDVLYGKLRPYLNKVIVADEPGVCTTEILPIRCYSNFDSGYLKNVLKSPSFVNYVNARSYGMKMPRLGTEDGRKAVFPLPPLAEQHRIVAKVDELMALCDQLEAQHNNADYAHEQLVSHLLSSLTQSKDAADFNANWQRIATHFDTLFTTESSIDFLKQTLLQLAVMGKLVPQDPNDEPASELLKRIQAEKAKLVAEGKIKKEKELSKVSENEKQFDLPMLWSWMRLGSIADLTGGIAFQSNKFLESGNNQVIRIGNVRPGTLRLDQKSVFIDNETVTNFRASSLSAGDLIITMTGTVGKRDYVYSAIIHDEYLANKSLFLNQRLCSVRPFLISPLYLDLAMKDDRLLDAIFSSATGTANQANISMAALNSWTLPLPPIAEQHRIVSKFNELMILCDQLISNINIGNRLQLKLADTLVEHAIS